jgi:ADP-ribose pyrophosphatase YjhB (NUDIX family)
VTRQPHSYCSYCGYPFAERQAWPRRCARCESITFRNPAPVALILQPVGAGLLLIRRNIQPKQGQLALPGGYIDFGETWQTAAVRELAEETGLVIEPAALEHFGTHSTPDGAFILIFGLAPALSPADLPPFQPSAETSERYLAFEPLELAFPLHTEVMRTFFARRR